MKVKTAELEGPALDWAVLEALKPDLKHPERAGISTFGPLFGKGYKYPSWGFTKYAPSRDWKEGGPIIDREGINTFKYNKLSDQEPDKWCGHKVVPRPNMEGSTNMVAIALDGPTPLIAAMRCYVASRLGDEVEVPDELVAHAHGQADASEDQAAAHRPRSR